MNNRELLYIDHHLLASAEEELDDLTGIEDEDLEEEVHESGKDPGVEDDVDEEDYDETLEGDELDDEDWDEGEEEEAAETEPDVELYSHFGPDN